MNGLNASLIQAGLKTTALGRRIHLFSELPSTNSYAFSLDKANMAHGTVILTEHQTAGRGRLGRRWLSPSQKNIACSIIVTDPRLEDHLTWIPLVTGLAIVETFKEDFHIKMALKWPNDIIMNGKKIGGILCENIRRDHSLGITVVGVGLNINTTPSDFSVELLSSSTSLSIECGKAFDRNVIISLMCNRLEQWYDRLATGNIATIRSSYIAFCATVGCPIRCLKADSEEIHGEAIGIAWDGALQIKAAGNSQQEVMELRSGDITHVRELKN